MPRIELCASLRLEIEASLIWDKCGRRSYSSSLSNYFRKRARQRLVVSGLWVAQGP